MRRVKSKERARAGNIYCDHCRPEKVDAIWRDVGFCAKFACDNHKHLLRNDDSDGRLTEADYQTWMRL